MNPEPVRVLHIVLSLNPGGAERLVVDLAKFASPGVEGAVCCLDERGAWAAELDEAGVPVHVLGRSPGFHPTLGRRIAALATQVGARVIHCHQYSPFVYGCLAKLVRPSLRIVFTEHGRLAGARVSLKRRMANAVLGRFPGQFFAVCGELRDFLLQEGFPASRLGVLYNGVQVGPLPDEAARQHGRGLLGLPAEGLVIGSVARLDPVKDLTTLVDAFRLAALPGARLVLVGDGPERGALESAVQSAGLSNTVTFAGQRSDVPELLPAFDFFVNSSTYEGVSLTIIEAMAAGCPVIATNVGGTPEVIEDGANGRLVPAGDAAALAVVLAELAASPDRARDLAAAGRRTVEERFRFEDMRDAYEATYRGER